MSAPKKSKLRRDTALLNKFYRLHIKHMRALKFISRLVSLITSHLATVVWWPSGMASSFIRILNF